MAAELTLTVAKLSTPPRGVLIVLADSELALGPAAGAVLDGAPGLVLRAAEADGFKGKLYAGLDILAPAALSVPRLVVIGVGGREDSRKIDWTRLGGVTMGRLPASATEATVLLETPWGPVDPDAVADFALGMRLRAYQFDRYKTRRKDNEPEVRPIAVTLASAGEGAVRKIL